MLILKSNKIVRECDGNILIKDVTGVIPENPTGFSKEGEDLISNDDYHVNDGVFLNIIYTKDRDGRMVVLNDCKIKPNGNRISNIDPNNYIFRLPVDGMIYSMMVFVIHKATYDTAPIDWWDENRPVTFYDSINNTLVYRSHGEDLIIKTFQEFVGFYNSVDTFTSQGIRIDLDTCFSISNITACQARILQSYLDKSLGYDEKTNKYRCPDNSCSKVDATLKNDMEFLRAVISSLRYLIECKNFADAEAILALLGKCGGVCSKYINTPVYRKQDCGC